MGLANSFHRYPNTPESALYNSKLDVDFEYVTKNVRATRSHELRAQTGNLGRRAQLGIPGSPDKTDPTFELNTQL